MTRSVLLKLLTIHLAILLSIVVFGQSLTFVGNTNLSLPNSGQLPTLGAYVEPYQSVSVTTQTYPISQGQSVILIYSTDHFATTQKVSFSYDGTVGNNTQWVANLGPLPQGGDVLFYIEANASNGITLYDNNNNQNFGYISRFEPTETRGAILQWFATPYSTILKRLPEVAKAGYGAIYLPPPTKGGGGGYSVGYNPFDRFDLGDRLQAGSIATQYGTTEQLQQVIQMAHRLGLKVYCDTVLNHNDNRASTAIDLYPNLIPEDFHIFSSADPNNNQIDFNQNNPFTLNILNNDLEGLADIAHEDGNLTEIGPFTLPSWASFNGYGKPSFVRQPLDPQLYPNFSPLPEDVRQYLKRWCTWLTTGLGFDGLRLDAAREIDPAFFENVNTQGGFQVNNGNLLPLMYSLSPNFFVMGEDDNSNSYEFREYIKTGMDLLDFDLFNNIQSVFNSNGFGNLGQTFGNDFSTDPATGLSFDAGGLGTDVGVSFVQSHDNGPPTSNNLAYALTMTRPGATIVYYDGNNLEPGNYTQFPKPGRADSLGYQDSYITTLANARERFGRGEIYYRYSSPNLLIYERQVNGIAVMLNGLNIRGDLTPLTEQIQTSFPANTILTDLSQQEPNVTVQSNGQVTITVPPNSTNTISNNATGYVVYVPLTPQLTSPITLTDIDHNAVLSPTQVNTPNGTYGNSPGYKDYVLTGNHLALQISTDIGNACFIEADNGIQLPNTSVLSNTPEGLADGYFQIGYTGTSTYTASNLDLSNLPDGIHLLKVRVFDNSGTNPGLFTDTYLFIDLERSRLISVNGDLTRSGSPIATQTLTPTSQSNRLDEMFIHNDDAYLYIGLAGQVSGGTNINGVVTFIDTETSSGAGYTTFNSIKDDYGPAGRLISNSNVTAPSGFVADAALVSFQARTLDSSPGTPVSGDASLPAAFGSQAGLFLLDPNNPALEQGLPSKIAWMPRANPFGPATGMEAAIPLASLFGKNLTQGAAIELLSYLTTTGETGTTLLAHDPNRATLGGRPQPHGYVLNQFLPVQPGITGDPGTNPVQLSKYVTYSLHFSQLNSSIQVTGSALRQTGKPGIWTNTVLVKNIGIRPISGPFYLVTEFNSAGGSLVGATGNAFQEPNAQYIYVKYGRLASNQTLRLTIYYQQTGNSAPQPSFLFRVGSGIP